jgi:hypothetical protein
VQVAREVARREKLARKAGIFERSDRFLVRQPRGDMPAATSTI